MLSFLVVPQRAVSCRVLSSPSSQAASCILWKLWRGTGRWCSAVKPREAHHPSTGECVTAVPHLSPSAHCSSPLMLLAFMPLTMSTSFSFRQPITGKCLNPVLNNPSLHVGSSTNKSKLSENSDALY